MDTKILILTHGGWGRELLKSIEMIIGHIDFVEEIPLLPNATFKEYYSEVQHYVKSMNMKIILFTDMFGGTTTNVGAKVANEENLKIITGLNAPLLLEACSQLLFQGEINFEALINVTRSSSFDVLEKIKEGQR